MACGQRGLRGLLAVRRQLAAAPAAGVRHAAASQQRAWSGLAAAAASSRLLPPGSPRSLAFPPRSFVFQSAQPYTTDSSVASDDANSSNSSETTEQRSPHPADEWYRQPGVPCLYIGGIPLRGNSLPQLMSVLDDGSTRLKMRLAYDSEKMREATANNPGIKYFFTKGFGFLYVESEERAQQILEKFDGTPVTFFKNVTRVLKVQKALNPRPPGVRRPERAADEPNTNVTSVPPAEGTDQPAGTPGHAVVTPETTNSEEVVEAAIDASMQQSDSSSSSSSLSSDSSSSSEDEADAQQQQHQQSEAEKLTSEGETTSTDEAAAPGSADSNKAA